MNEDTPVPPLKVCAACGEGKPVEDFYRVRKDSETRFSYCKECAKKKSREWYKTHGRNTKTSMKAHEVNAAYAAEFDV